MLLAHMTAMEPPRKCYVFEALPFLRPEDLQTSVKLRGSGDVMKFQLFDEVHPNAATHELFGRSLAEVLERLLSGNDGTADQWVSWFCLIFCWLSGFVDVQYFDVFWCHYPLLLLIFSLWFFKGLMCHSLMSAGDAVTKNTWTWWQQQTWEILQDGAQGKTSETMFNCFRFGSRVQWRFGSYPYLDHFIITRSLDMSIPLSCFGNVRKYTLYISEMRAKLRTMAFK